jgi:hypothetical protein
MVKALKVGAIICLVLAAIVFSTAFLADSSFTHGGGEVIRKYTENSGSQTQFRLDCGLKSGGEYNSTYSKSFYDIAKLGDQLRFPLTGMTELVRDGHVIKYNFSEDFVFPTVFTLLALLPGVVFVRRDRLPIPRVIYIILGSIEVLIIGGALVGTFMPCC